MDCKTVMAPIKVKLYADELAGNVIDFMVEKHMGLVPVVERDGTFAGLASSPSSINTGTADGSDPTDIVPAVPALRTRSSDGF